MFTDTVNCWAPQQSTPMTLQICKILHERIVNNDLKPGDRMSASEIEHSYGVTRQPLQPAFVKLAERSRTTMRPRLGAIVRRIAWSAVLDARFLREAIEAYIGSCWRMRPTPRS